MRAARKGNIDQRDDPAPQRSMTYPHFEGQHRSDGPRPLLVERAKVAPVAISKRKRGFDLAVAGLTLLFLAPFMLLVATAIFVETGGPILFRQDRTGYRGRVFTIFKFRTMKVAEEGAHARQATRDDDRVTKVGFLLRKSSLDELPQLFNVVRGEMSLIGPRPHAVGHDAQFASFASNYAERFQAKPGLTGLAQVCGHRGEVRGPECIRRRVAADDEYIRTWSFWLDMTIVIRTIPLLFRDPQAY